MRKCVAASRKTQRARYRGGRRAVEGEATAGGEAAGELEMDVGVVLPVVPCVDEPVDAPEEGESEEKCGCDAGLRGRAVLRGHRWAFLGAEHHGRKNRSWIEKLTSAAKAAIQCSVYRTGKPVPLSKTGFHSM